MKLPGCCRTEFELGSGFGRFLAAKIEFSYGAGQTVNLLALRLQWFESTPAQASPRTVRWTITRRCHCRTGFAPAEMINAIIGFAYPPGTVAPRFKSFHLQQSFERMVAAPKGSRQSA